MILAIDIGGTKFTTAVFDGARMVRRESRSTDAQGGKDWMLSQLRQIIGAWRSDFTFDHCGIGFGGPVDWASQRVLLSTHVGGWRDFDLPAYIGGLAGAPAVMDNDANAGATGGSCSVLLIPGDPWGPVAPVSPVTPGGPWGPGVTL